MKDKKKSLFLCFTPLQARICLEIINLHKMDSYDVVYYTTHDNPRDQIYFKKLRKNSNYSFYYFGKKVPRGLNSLISISFIRKLSAQLKRDRYEYIYIASIDNYLFRYIIKKHPESRLIGFDDGSANITLSSSYYNLDQRKRAVIINKMLGLPAPKKVINSMINHYTIYPNFKNIIEDEKLISIKVFDTPPNYENFNETTTFFIGQPFEYYLTDKEKSRLRQLLSTYEIDYYIMHPKETDPLIINTTVLDKTEWLAEDIIIEASKNSKVQVISGFSTVLFNLSGSHIERTYLSISTDTRELERCLLIEKTGAHTVKLYK